MCWSTSIFCHLVMSFLVGLCEEEAETTESYVVRLVDNLGKNEENWILFWITLTQCQRTQYILYDDWECTKEFYLIANYQTIFGIWGWLYSWWRWLVFCKWGGILLSKLFVADSIMGSLGSRHGLELRLEDMILSSEISWFVESGEESNTIWLKDTIGRGTPRLSWMLFFSSLQVSSISIVKSRAEINSM